MSRREEWAELLDLFLKGAVLLFGGGGILEGAAVLLYQITDWLKTGEWLPVPVWEGFERLWPGFTFVSEIEWRGLQKILVWLLDLPLSVVLPFPGILLALGVVALVAPIIESLRPPPKPRREWSETD